GDDVLLGVSLTEYLLYDAPIGSAHAGQLLTEAIACTERSGDRLFAYFLSNNAGVHALRAGDIPAAKAYLHRAAQAIRAFGGESPQLTINTGWMLRQAHDSDSARSSFEAVLRTSRRNGDRAGLAYASL